MESVATIIIEHLSMVALTERVCDAVASCGGHEGEECVLCRAVDGSPAGVYGHGYRVCVPCALGCIQCDGDTQ